MVEEICHRSERFSAEETDLLVRKVKACEEIPNGSCIHLSVLGFDNLPNFTAHSNALMDYLTFYVQFC